MVTEANELTLESRILNKDMTKTFVSDCLNVLQIILKEQTL